MIFSKLSKKLITGNSHRQNFQNPQICVHLTSFAFILAKHLLSKSTFIRGTQCPKSLYLYKNFIQLRDQPSAEQKAIFSRGNKVGLYAQRLFPGGKDISLLCKNDSAAGVELTRKMIGEGQEILYEAMFMHKGVLVILDILVKDEAGWKAYEVKSSLKISPTYVLDACLQYWVITGAGIALDDFFLVHMNPNYHLADKLDPHELFRFSSVRSKAIDRFSEMEEKVSALLPVVTSAKMPEVPIGEQCFSPYPCDFMGTCWKNIPQPSIFQLPGAPKSELFRLFHQGIQTVDQIPMQNELGKELNKHLSALRRNEVLLDKEKLGQFFGKIRYPLLFMDFESFMPAIPLFKGTKPYQHLPFQYSIHRKPTPDAAVEHCDFLAEPGIDPRTGFLESLLLHTAGDGTILVYDALMERSILQKLKELFPQYGVEIDQRLSRLLDLAVPFQEKWFYHWRMNNSFSIKNILPALVPGSDFSHLAVSSGSIAMIVFEQMQTQTDLFKLAEEREQLLAYCKMDTWAMVQLFAALEKAVQE